MPFFLIVKIEYPPPSSIVGYLYLVDLGTPLLHGPSHPGVLPAGLHQSVVKMSKLNQLGLHHSHFTFYDQLWMTHSTSLSFSSHSIPFGRNFPSFKFFSVSGKLAEGLRHDTEGELAYSSCPLTILMSDFLGGHGKALCVVDIVVRLFFSPLFNSFRLEGPEILI